MCPKKLIAVIAVLISIFGIGKLYAQEVSSASDFITITGRVTDRATSHPIMNAEVALNLQGRSQKVFTDNNGEYHFSLELTFWPWFAGLRVSKAEYLTETSTVIFFGPNNNIKRDFRLRDHIKPQLQILSPEPQEEIFANPTIIIRYQDAGSGINTASLRILFEDRDLTGYLTVINEQEASCVVPSNQPLPLGNHRLYVRVSDRAGNRAEDRIFVQVVKEDEYYIRKGKQALLKRDILRAHEYFQKAVNAANTNPEANFYYAFTRLAVLPLDDEIFTLLQNMGFLGPQGEPLAKAHLDPFHFKAVPPPVGQRFDLTAEFPNGLTIQEVLEHKIIAEMNQALKNLNLVLSRKDFVSYLKMDNSFTGTQQVEIDYADAALLKSLILSIQAKLYELLVRNLEFEPAQLNALFNQGHLNLGYMLELYPRLLRVENIPYSLRARQALIKAIDWYIAGFNSMLAEREDQSDDLLSISRAPEYRKEALLFENQIRDVKKSLRGQHDARFSPTFNQFVNLGRFFSDPFDFRRLLDRDSAAYLLRENILPQADYLLASFSRASDTYRQLLPPKNSFYKGQMKELDFADIAAAKFGLESVQVVALSTLGYNLEIDTPVLATDALGGRPINVQDILDRNPALGNIADTAYLNLAASVFSRLSETYKTAADYLLFHEDPDQTDDLLVPTEYFNSNAGRLEGMLLNLTRMQDTLINPRVEITGNEIRVNPAEFFLYYKNARQFFPRFDEDSRVIAGSWPDRRFGGILPDNETLESIDVSL